MNRGAAVKSKVATTDALFFENHIDTHYSCKD